jgi:hypothetical protein
MYPIKMLTLPQTNFGLRCDHTLRGATIALLKRISATIGHGHVHVRSRHLVARTGRAHSVWHWATKVSSIAAAAATSSTETTSRAVVGCLVNSDSSPVKQLLRQDQTPQTSGEEWSPLCAMLGHR